MDRIKSFARRRPQANLHPLPSDRIGDRKKTALALNPLHRRSGEMRIISSFLTTRELAVLASTCKAFRDELSDMPSLILLRPLKPLLPASPAFGAPAALRFGNWRIPTFLQHSPTQASLAKRSKEAEEHTTRMEQGVFKSVSDQLSPSERLEPEEIDPRHSVLRGAVNAGKVELVQRGLHAFLTLPERFLTRDQKVAWLREAMGTSTLKYFCQYPGEGLQEKEQRRCEAIMAAICEVVSWRDLAQAETIGLCIRIEREELDHLGAKTHAAYRLVTIAMGNDNPAVAASILLGIQESSAAPGLKRSLLNEAAETWPDLAHCVANVFESLDRHAAKAPVWVRGILQRLASINATPLPNATELAVNT